MDDHPQGKPAQGDRRDVVSLVHASGQYAAGLCGTLLTEIRISADQQMLAGIVLIARASLGQVAVRSHAVGVGHGLLPKLIRAWHL